MTLVYLALAWLFGIALGACCARPPLLWAACALAGALVVALGRREPARRLAGALLALAALGALRITSSPLYATPLRPYLDGPPVTLTGVVAEAPDVRPARTELQLAVEAVDDGQGERRLGGGVLARLPRESPYRYGDRLRLTGRLRTPADEAGFSYRAYLARRGIHALLEAPEVELLGRGQGSPVRAALIALADRAEALIGSFWPAPESALLAGILLGRERGIPEPLLEAFNDTGTRHIIAISGFNITLLAGTLSALLVKWLNRRAAVPVVIALLALYTALVGADPAVLRAALMGGLTLLALLAGRRAHALTGLALAAVLMTLWQPWTLWEPSFQLSFAATLGLIVLQPSLVAWLSRTTDPGTEGTGGTRGTEGQEQPPSVPSVPLVPSVPVPGWLREAVMVSLSAQIATLPITLGTFGRLSLVAPLGNLLILPAQPAVMQLGALATVLGLAFRPLGQLVAYLAWPFTAYTIAVVEALGQLPWAAADSRLAGPLPWALYGLAGVILWLRADPGRRQAAWGLVRRQAASKALILALAALCTFVWIGGVARRPDGRLHVTFLDVGQGDATLIRTPAGQWLLIDGGPEPTRTLAALGRRLYPWQRHLDLVALTHPDEDHMAGLVSVLRRYRPGLILDTRLPRDTPTGEAWQALIAPDTVRDTQHAIRNTNPVRRIAYPTRGTIVDLGSGVRLQVLHPGERLLTGTPADDNNNSLVLRLSYGRASFLLTGDLGMAGEAHLLAQDDLPLQSTVLKVAHHGAGEATTLRFLDAVQPQVAVISVGAGNRFGHPSPEVLARLEKVGVRVWRTDRCGDVEIVTDGERLWVRTGRQER